MRLISESRWGYRRISKVHLLLAYLTIFCFWPLISQAEVEITLNNSFIEKYKDRATIEATFSVDKAHKKPNPPKKDGDLHVAGRAPEIGLAAVAEIMNAKLEKEAVSLIHQAEGTGNPLKIGGAWRLWCEHGGGADQIQGKNLEPFDTTNPDHVFQIHPVAHINDKDVSNSFTPIDGFKPKEASEAFTRYENKYCRIIPDTTTTTIVTTMVGYNYVEFIMEINKNEEIEDGRRITASVLDLDEELLIRNRYMIFVKDTPPEKKVRNLKPGTRLHVLGIPRISLAQVAKLVKKYKNQPERLSRNLPYEIIIVEIYEE